MDLVAFVKELDRTQWVKRERPMLKGPILTRYDLQTMKAPPGDFVGRTSGSVGIPVEVQRTHLSKLWWVATNLREAVWHKRDLSQTFATIRPSVSEITARPDWGSAFSLLGKTGASFAHPVAGDLNQWLQEIQPGYLMTFPSILETIDLSLLPSLKGIKTTGEKLYQKSPLIQDMYSCEEVGTIAIQCPDCPDVYHVMENILLEILDDNDQPAEIGRVVLTDLASRYLYRYDIGDYAEIGHCACGRGLQTLKNIRGRRRNLVLLPDGSTQWPLIGSMEYRKIAPIKRYQIAQVSPTTLEFRHSIDTFLTDRQKIELTKIIQRFIGYPFEIHFEQVDAFGHEKKYEEFINRLL